MLRHRIFLGLFLTLATGCLYEIRDEVNDFELNCKNSCSAKLAWYSCGNVYRDMDHRRDFKKGFIAGYTAVAFGSSGCPPSIPPSCYWKAIHTTATGKARANAWFDGFSHGALAAEADGIAESNRIVTRGGQKPNAPASNMMNMPGGDMGTLDRSPADFVPPAPYAETPISAPTPAP